MMLPNPGDAIHKAWMYKLLTAIADDAFLSANLRFKGGTCAAMQDLIKRFSVDLDFDLIDESKIDTVRDHLENIFEKLGLEIKDKSRKVPQYFLKYPAKKAHNQRTTLKVDITCPPPKNNKYEPVRLIEIDRIVHCQTVETMFANKMIALMERFEKNGSIAGRDLFDIHTFFINGESYNPEIIKERTDLELLDFLKKLKKFIKDKVTQTVIDQDLNALLPPKEFQNIRKTLKQETLVFVNDEILRIQESKD